MSSPTDRYTAADAAIRALSDALDALERAAGHLDGTDNHLAMGARRLARNTRTVIAVETDARDAAEAELRAEEAA